MRQSARIKLGGGGLNSLTKDTILRGKGQNITDIDYDNIVNNRLVFEGPDLYITKTSIDANDITCNIVHFDRSSYYRNYEVDSIFQIKLIPNLGIKLTDNNNISVNFSDGGWSSNYNNNELYTYSDKIGIGISEPLSTLHIKNNNASLIIDNNYNQFKFNYNDDKFILGNNNINQLHIHNQAKDNSLSIDTNSTVNIGYNLNVNGNTILTPNIFIGNVDIINWLINSNIATENYVKNNKNLTADTILYGDGNNITNLDYNNITSNKLIFLNPLNYNNNDNTISIDLTATGWTNVNVNDNNNNNNVIYSSFNSKIGIGTSEPLGTLHIGSTYNEGIYNNNNGTLIISKTSTTLNKNFKLGYDDNFNFVFGNLTKNTNIWSKQFYINTNAPSESLIIDNLGNININSNLLINGFLILNKNNINYNLNINNYNNLNIANTLFINDNGLIGIGIQPDIENNNKLYINGNVKILSDLYVNDIYANYGSFNNINISNLKVLSNLDVLLNISGSNINTNSLSSTNIKTNNINVNNYIYTKNILSSNSIYTPSFNVNNITCSNNIILFNNLNVNNINVKNDIICKNIEILYNLKSSNVIISSNLLVSSNIYANLLLYSSNNIIAENNLYSKNIETYNINSINSINTNTIISKNITNNNKLITNDIITSTLFTSNIKTYAIDTSNFKANNIIITDNIKSANIINDDNILSYNLSIDNNILCRNNITTYSINSTIVETTNIGINTSVPLCELHICKNVNLNNDNTSLIITGTNNSFKIGYTYNDDFILGNYNDSIWKKQIYINANAPDNTIIIKESGNIIFGNDINILDIYKLNVIGNLNATNIYENGIKILNNDTINTIIDNKLDKYLSIDNAIIKYPSKYSVKTDIYDSFNSIEYLLTSLLSFNSNIYSNEKKYPYNNITPITTILQSKDLEYYVNNNIYGIKEKFSETILNFDNSEIIREYTIYYSSAKKAFNFNIIDKHNLFDYYNNYNLNIYSCAWGDNNYKNSYYRSAFNGNQTNINNLYLSKIISTTTNINGIAKFVGDFIIIYYNFDFIFTKFRFYCLNTKISNAPAMWRCYVSNDANTWEILKDASNDINVSYALHGTDYIAINDNYSYYEKIFNNTNKYKYIGFVFYKITNENNPIDNLINLELFKLEMFGRDLLNPLYISSNVLNNILTNYAKNDYINNNIQGKIEVTSPLEFDGSTLTINPLLLYNIDSTIPQIYDNLSNNIINYINSKTDIWNKQTGINNIYYTNGTVGIGTTIPNINNEYNLKLNVYGNINVSNINISNNINVYNNIYGNNIIATNTITAIKYNGDGSLLTNINYNNIVTNKPNLTNINNWNLSINNNISNCYNILNGNIGIGFPLTTQLTTKFSVNGNIYSTATINAINLQENSINISDKYLSITNANTNFLKLSGGIISGSIGIGTDISPNFKVNINGSLNAITINSINIIEDGNYISNKYLSITNANNEYISKANGGIINNNLIILHNLLIGTTTITNNKLTVNGNIYSSNNISCYGNLNEGGSNLIDKYLTIINANNNFLKLSGGIISGSVGIDTDISPNFKLNINGSLNTNSLYINNSLIDFTSFSTNTALTSTLLSYPTLTYLSNNYITLTNFNNNLSLYSTTGTDPNYLKITDGIIANDTTFSKNLITSNLITSNLTSLNQIITSNLTSLNQIITSNLTSSNIISLNQINTSNITSLNQINTSNLISSNILTNTIINYGKVSIGSSTLSQYNLFINGSLNTNSLYINNSLIDFTSFSTNTALTSTLLSYPTLTYLSNNYITLTNFNNNLSLYSTTGTDPNYLKITGGIITNDTTFSKNLITSNLISSNILTNTIINYGKVSIGSSTLSQYNLFINGSLNTNSLYINNELIDFTSFSTNTALTSTLLSYPTLTYLSNNYITLTNFNNNLSLYSTTGTDPNYLKITGGIITNDTTFSKNLITSNLISSNIQTNNINSSNINNINLLSSYSIYAINNIGIGTNQSSLYKLNVNGSIYSSNNISCSQNFIENGSNLSDKYLTIANASNNYFKINGGIINNNVGIGTDISLLYKLNVNGSIYSSNNISCSQNFIENGSNLIDKYLTIDNAYNNYLSINGGTILNNLNILSNLGIGTSANNIYKLTVKGAIYSSTNIFCTGFVSENGITLTNKYLSINGGVISSNLTINSNVGIGTIASDLYKLNVKGVIYSSNDMICDGNIKENGNYLNNKYLSINGGNIFNNLTINSNVGIGTIASDLYKLNVKGVIYSSNDIICDGNIKEGGSNLKDKYLSINDAANIINTEVLRNEISSNQPNVQKKYGFRFICNKPIILNNETYYKHDVNLSLYIKTKIDSIDANPYRIFGIKCFSTSAIFTNAIVNKPPNILQYDIYTSYIINTSTINITAIGFPSNYYLNRITSGDIFLLKTTNYNYISILSRTKDLSISCIISDFLF